MKKTIVFISNVFISVFFFKAFMRFDRGTGQVIVILLFKQKNPIGFFTL